MLFIDGNIMMIIYSRFNSISNVSLAFHNLEEVTIFIDDLLAFLLYPDGVTQERISAVSCVLQSPSMALSMQAK